MLDAVKPKDRHRGNSGLTADTSRRVKLKELREVLPTLQKPLAGSDQKTEIDELAFRRGKNLKIEIGDLPLAVLKPLIGSNLRTEIEELP